MKIYEDIDFKDFAPCAEAKGTYDKIIDAGRDCEFEGMIEELFPNGVTETELNDYLWFDDDQILRDLRIIEEQDEDEYEEEEDEGEEDEDE